MTTNDQLSNRTYIVDALTIKPSPISIVSLSVSASPSFRATSIASSDEAISSLIFRTSDTVRLIDLAKERSFFESKYKLSSEDFFSAWKAGAKFRSRDFDQWAKLCQRISYVDA